MIGLIVDTSEYGSRPGDDEYGCWHFVDSDDVYLPTCRDMTYGEALYRLLDLYGGDRYRLCPSSYAYC